MKDIYYGGSFNPFHYGHLDIVNTLLSTLDFKQEYNGIVIDPVVKKWSLGTEISLIPREIRVKMIQDAITDTSRVMVNDIPVEGTNNSTYESIEFLLDRQILYFPISIVIGADNAEVIEHWYRWKTLVQRFEFIIITREGHQIDLSKFPNHKVITVNNPLSSTLVRRMIGTIDVESAEPFMPKKSFETLLTYYKS